MANRRKLYLFLFVLFFLMLFAVSLGSLIAGNALTAPVRKDIPLPKGEFFKEVEFGSPSGARIRGWYGHRERAVASVMLLHGVRSDRREMQGRALWFYKKQMNVLLFDFQAHGASDGEAITFGYREALDVEAGFRFLKEHAAGAPIGAVGFSLGGAAALLSKTAREFDFLILEAVYPDIEAAIGNRLAMRFGRLGFLLTPLLSVQLRLRFGIETRQLRPITGLQDLHCPVLVIGGSEDRRTTLRDSMRMLNAAKMPRSLWIVDGASHENFYAHSPAEYKKRVFGFIEEALSAREEALGTR